jgi:hypothetical protein
MDIDQARPLLQSFAASVRLVMAGMRDGGHA